MSCPTGPKGIEGWSSTDIVHTKMARLESVCKVDGKEVRDGRDELLYVDRTRQELGVRLTTGDRIFVPLADVLELLKKGVL